MTTDTSILPAKSSFLPEAEKIAGRLNSSQPAFAVHRSRAAAAFGKLGIPGKKHEEWRYLDLTFIENAGYRTVSFAEEQQLKEKDAMQFSLAGSDAILCIIENGLLNREASNLAHLPKGIRIETLSGFLDNSLVKEHIFKHAEVEDDALVAMNTMLCMDPVVILVDKGVKITSPVQLAFVANGVEEPLMIPARVLLVLGEQSECTLVESYHSYKSNAPVFTNAVTEVVLGRAARYFGTKIQAEAANARQINYHKVVMARDSYQHLTTVSLGGELVRNTLQIHMDGKNANSWLNGLYVANGTQVIDNHTLVDHALSDCYSNELYKGILDDQALGVFNGKIRVRQDAQKTNAYQSNKNLLLSNEASMNTKPQLEIFADDVKCSHGATTGQLDDEALFYLRARGIGEKTARALLNHAFAADVIDQIENAAVRDSLMRLLDSKLAGV